MAVTVGQLATKSVLAAVVAALDVAAIKTALGYAVQVWNALPQRKRYPAVRVDGAGEVANSTMGRNGKDVAVYVQIFDDYEGEIRIIEIGSAVLAILNPAGNYHALSVSGYTTEHVNFDGLDDMPDEDEAGKAIKHKTAKFTVTVNE